MSRTLNEIRVSFYAAKAAKAELDNLVATPDGTATWELWSEVVIFCLWFMEQVFDTHKADVESYIANSYPNTVPWIHAQCMAYQYGDTLVYINNRFQYEVIDETKKIIKRCAVVEYGNFVFVKVAKLDNNEPVPLSTPELEAFRDGYIKKIKAPGQRISIYNLTADELLIEADIYYNPLVLAADGTLLSDGATMPAEIEVNKYCAGIVFGGEVNINKILDSLTGAVGVSDAVINSLQAKASNSIAFQNIAHKYTALSGYYKVSTLNLTYIPDVSV